MRGNSNLPDKTSNETSLALDAHVKNQENPHEVTAEQVMMADGKTSVQSAVEKASENLGDNGVMTVAGGGTGKSSLTEGSYLVGNGTEDVVLKTPAEVRSDIGAAAEEHTHDYAPSYAYGTEDMEAGVTPLPTGSLYFMYE